MLEYSPSEITVLPLQQAYQAFIVTVIHEHVKENIIKDIYNKVRYGIHIQFDINEYFAGVIFLDEEHGCFAHKFRPKTIDVTKMYSELEEREQLTKLTLLESIKSEPLFDDIEVDSFGRL